MAGIRVENVSIDFPIYHGDARSLKKLAFSTASGRIARDNQKRVIVQALRDVSFTLQAGERLVLVGGNGAGKTTLLRCLAGIYQPNTGSVRVDGELSTLLDVSLGMIVDLTGRENILLRGRYIGLSRAETARMEQDVAEFAEIGEFLDLPVKSYSSGMMLRLAFAMATSSNPGILLMDEWLLAGDASFFAKAHARIEQFVKQAEILVLSTHNEEIARKWATRVLYLDGGRVIADGGVDEVFDLYASRAGVPAKEPVAV